MKLWSGVGEAGLGVRAPALSFKSSDRSYLGLTYSGASADGDDVDRLSSLQKPQCLIRRPLRLLRRLPPLWCLEAARWAVRAHGW